MGVQEAALPPGAVVVSCSAPFGAGGLGRHLREIVEALDRRGTPAHCICGSTEGPAEAACGSTRGPAEAAARERDRRPRGGTAALATAIAPFTRFSPAWRAWQAHVEFDAHASRRLPAGSEHHIAFNGQALAQLRVARRMRWKSVALMSATVHLRQVVRQHDLAHRQYPLEGSWATRLLERNLAEYEQADRIYVSSRHAWESFAEEGVPDERLSFFPLTPDPRYTPADAPGARDTFDIVYVGSLSVAKGVPLLIDAVRSLPQRDIRLVLVGGWGTRGMRRFVQRSAAADPRIAVRPGDPLAPLRQAALCVHPSYADGFAYAPVEALACGVPAIVSEHSGMKDLIEPGRNGVVLPTGDRSALTQAIEAAYRGELLGG
jgi:glycosyltransferase involved in cell wall biosynthesis